MTTYAVIDFETTGLSPAYGARPTEIAVVLVQGDRIVDHYQSLMNPGVSIPYNIQVLTGITNQMVRKAPSVRQVMSKAVEFAGAYPIVAHNAAFDRQFWEAETCSLGLADCQPFICSLLLARRLFPDSPNHKLATLVKTLNLPGSGQYHRALADAEYTAYLLIRLQQELRQRFNATLVDAGLMLAVQRNSSRQLASCVEKYCG